MLDLLVWASWIILGVYSFYFFFKAKAYKKITEEQKLMSLFILSAVFFGVQLMTLESIKNIVFARYLESVVVWKLPS